MWFILKIDVMPLQIIAPLSAMRANIYILCNFEGNQDRLHIPLVNFGCSL